jgi:hypothetical protein
MLRNRHIVALYLFGFIFVINEEIFMGTMIMTMHPPAN